MNTINLIKYIEEFKYKKYFFEQLDLMLHPVKHFNTIIAFVKNNFFEETTTFKVLPSDLQVYIKNKQIISKTQTMSYVSISLTSNCLSLINKTQRDIILKKVA